MTAHDDHPWLAGMSLRFPEAVEALDEIDQLRGNLTAADAMLAKAVHEIDRVDALRTNGLSHEDAWALVAVVFGSHPKAKTPASIYEYLRCIRADTPEDES